MNQKLRSALAFVGLTDASPPVGAGCPALDHPQLTGSCDALDFFKGLLSTERSPSLAAWARDRAKHADAVTQCRTRPWLRVVLQKIASEEHVPEVLACLRAVYGAGEAIRIELLAGETQLLEACHRPDFQKWRSALGLDRPARTEAGIQTRPRRSADATAEPDVTVVVPSYRHEAYIEPALESVLAQTHTAFELRVVDDCSPDRTIERARRVSDPRISIAVNDKTLGLGDSLLNALSTITTPYVAVLNSDDLFHCDRLKRCTAVLRGSPEVEVVATGLITIDAEGRRIAPDNVRPLFDGADIANWIDWFARAGQVDWEADPLAELLERNFLVTSSNIVCRTDFLRSRRDHLQGLKYCFDWQVFLDAAAGRALAYLPEALVGYRLHPTNTVWFDQERQADYRREVNRVLGGTLERLIHAPSSHPAAGKLPRILELLAWHAAKHSDAQHIIGHALRLIRLFTGGAGATTASGRRSPGL